MPREIIRPNYGEPCIVQLACDPEGTQREGSYGIDFQYELNHDIAITWLPKEARDAIVASGAKPGDEIAITKAKRGRQTVWTVERTADETPHRSRPAARPQTRRSRSQTACSRSRRNGQRQAATAAPRRRDSRGRALRG
ncbi:MAG: hypothetical protein JO108_18980, partial [Acidobacteriaceae bacterium]|nr:hypothetical protein [Acidobacteriaceae bacterium]